MPLSPYMRGLRELVGNKLVLSPGVTAVIRRDEKFLVARQRDSGLWSLVGTAVQKQARLRKTTQFHPKSGVFPQSSLLLARPVVNARPAG